MTTAPPRRRWKLPRTALLLVAATAAAGATSAALRKPEPPPEPTAAPAPVPVTAPADPDALIRAGHFAGALAACTSQPGGAYREGLCLEALGRWADAADAYRRAVEPDGDAGARARATLGQARCAASAGDLPAARQWLAGVAARFPQPDAAARGVFEECAHLRARLEVLALGPPRPTDPLDPDAVAWPPLTADVSRYPDALPADGPPGSPEKGADEPRVTEPPLPPANATAAAALRRALADAPDHPSAAAVRVTLANLLFEAGRLREAAAGYRDVADDPAVGVYAAHNLGLLELRRANLPAARARFTEVVDRGWPAVGWWWVGRTHLDAGDTADARAAFRAAAGAKAKPGKDVTSAAALGMAACDLLDGDDAAARAALQHHRAWGAAHRAAADWLGGWVRYRVAPSAGRREELVAAVGAADDGRRLGPAGVLLAGAAYRELGLPDRAVAVYDAAAETCRGPLAARMTFAAARRFDELDLRPAARQRYLVVAATDPRGYGPRAELRVAELAARDGRGAECVVRCRGLVGNPGVGRDDVLAVMGRGYELAKDYRRAAECFAGQLPAE